MLPASLRARSAPLDAALADLTAGRRQEARAALDSLLAADALGEAERGEAEYHRALLEEDGAAFEERIRNLLRREVTPARKGRLHLRLGHVAFARKDLEGALAEFRLARDGGLKEEGSLWEGLTALALGDGVAAREGLEQAAASGNSSIRQRARLALGDAHRLSGNWEAAVKAYRQVREDLRTGPGWWPTAAYHEADCLETLGRRDEAIAILQDLVERFPAAYEAPLARNRLRAWADFLLDEEGEEERPDEPPVPVPGGEGPPQTPIAAGPGFTLQVGAFGMSANAEGLARALRGRGVEGVRVETGEDALHRVLIGRFPTRDAAETAGDSLGTEFSIGFTVLSAGEE